VTGKIKELIGGVRSLNVGSSTEVPESITGDDEPCYWQRKEWIDWILELADEAEKELLDDK
jgi:hypothetical protein